MSGGKERVERIGIDAIVEWLGEFGGGDVQGGRKLVDDPFGKRSFITISWVKLSHGTVRRSVSDHTVSMFADWPRVAG